MIALSRFAVVTLIAPLIGCGCGSGSGAPGAPLSNSEAADLCDRYCDAEAACGNPDEQCFAGCTVLLAPYLRADVFTAQYECYIELGCAGDPSTCDAFATSQPLDFHLALGDKCREHLDCVTEGFCFNLTSDLRNFHSGVVADFSACFDEPTCVEIETCLDDVVAGIPLFNI